LVEKGKEDAFLASLKIAELPTNLGWESKRVISAPHGSFITDWTPPYFMALAKIV